MDLCHRAAAFSVFHTGQRISSPEWSDDLSGTAFRERSGNPDAISGKKSADPDAFSESADFGKAVKWVQNAAAASQLLLHPHRKHKAKPLVRLKI